MCGDIHTFAVYSHAAVSVLTNPQEFSHDIIRGAGAINEIHIIVLKASCSETTSVIDLLVEAHYCGYIVLAEVAEVRFRRVQCVSILHLALRVWTTEGEKFARNDPVEVTILYLLLSISWSIARKKIATLKLVITGYKSGYNFNVVLQIWTWTIQSFHRLRRMKIIYSDIII